MRIIGNKYIRVEQGFNLLLFFMFLSVSILLGLVAKSLDDTYVFMTGGTIWGIVTFFHLKIFEVVVGENKITLRNLFSKIKVKKSDFKKIVRTLFSPFIFRITLEGSKRYFFMIGADTLLKAMFSFDSNYTIKALNEAIGSNELTQSHKVFKS